MAAPTADAAGTECVRRSSDGAEKAAAAVRAWAEETNRLNRERNAAGEADRNELADIEKKMATMISAIEDGGYRECRSRGQDLNLRPSGYEFVYSLFAVSRHISPVTAPLRL